MPKSDTLWICLFRKRAEFVWQCILSPTLTPTARICPLLASSPPSPVPSPEQLVPLISLLASPHTSLLEQTSPCHIPLNPPCTLGTGPQSSLWPTRSCVIWLQLFLGLISTHASPCSFSDMPCLLPPLRHHTLLSAGNSSHTWLLWSLLMFLPLSNLPWLTFLKQPSLLSCPALFSS